MVRLGEDNPLQLPLKGRDRVDKVAIFGIGGAEVGSHAGNEERTGVVLACGYIGVVSYGVGVEEKRFADFNGLGSGRGGKHPVGTSLSSEG